MDKSPPRTLIRPQIANSNSVSPRMKSKQSAPQEKFGNRFIWYRISFACRHTGRYVASSKRMITWRFGSVSHMTHGVDEYEDHEVSLVWSVKSGKMKLVWNGQDISRLFREYRNKKPAPNVLDFAWQSARGIKFQAVANANPTGNANQYEFFIDGKPFSALPSKEKAVKNRSKETKTELTGIRSSDGSVERTASADFAGSCGELSGDGGNDPEQQSRLAYAGFTYKFDMEDELRSDYSSTLDALRDAVASSVPQTEEMISRAIINAFSEDHDSDTSNESLNSEKFINPAEVEVEILGDTFEWLKWSRDFVSNFDLNDRKLEHMQKQVGQMVSHVRHDRLQPNAASLILLRVAAILKLEVKRDPVPDTVMLCNLNSLTTSSDIMEAMRFYGEIIEAAVSKNHEGYGFCRFKSCATVHRVCEAGKRGEITVNGRQTEVFGLFESPHSLDFESDVVESRDRDYDYDCYEDMERYNRDHIDPSDEGIEATYNYTGSHRGSLSISNLQPNAATHSSLESSTSSYIYQRPSYKNTSTGTINTLSTVDVDDLDTSTNAFVPMAVLD